MPKITSNRPQLGIQGTVIAWQDPWAREVSDQILRTGEGKIYPSQDPRPEPHAFLAMLKEMGADFYLHHVMPGMQGQSDMLRDIAAFDMDVCLGNEYGNANGPWVEGTNRYDLPDDRLLEAAKTGKLIGLVYDETEHLQINANIYRKEVWEPQWAQTRGLILQEAREKVEDAISKRVAHCRKVLETAGIEPANIPLISEQVFPVLHHTMARGGMTVCPKIMKEAFQSIELSTALGAAKQYGRDLWICADLWGPDLGPWFTRVWGLPGHSPEEYESALRMGYYMGPTHLYAENVDALMRHTNSGFMKTAHGEVWSRFVKDFVPNHPLTWSHRDLDPDIVIIRAEDSDYGQSGRLFGSDESKEIAATRSSFAIWHLLSRGATPRHGISMHAGGFAFSVSEEPRTMENVMKFPKEQGIPADQARPIHGLFYPVNNAAVFDEFADYNTIGTPKLIFVAGSRVSAETLKAVKKKASEGAVCIIAKWLLPVEEQTSRREGQGMWMVTEDFLDPNVREAAEPYLGDRECWVQRFGDTQVRMYKKDPQGFTLDFEIEQRKAR